MKITERQKKLIFVGVALVCVAAVYRFLPFFEDLLSSQDNSYIEQRITKLQKKVALKKRLEKKHVSLDRHLNKLETGLLDGSTTSLAAVTIQNLLYDLASKYEVDIQSVRVLKSTKNEDETLSMYTIISIQARMQLTISQLKEILYDFAKSTNIVVVDALNVQVVKKGQEGKIMATLTLKGMMAE